MKEPGHHDTIELSTDYHRILYRQHFQGALVRSAASVAMWLFALVAFLTNDIDIHSFKGISLSVIFLISITPPTLWFLKVISRRTRVYKYFSILINLLEIFGYTTIIYFMGGIESAYLTLIYAALITYVGIIAPRRLPFVIAVLCSVMFGLLVIGEHFGVIPHQRIVSYRDIPWLSQQFRLAVVIGLLFIVAYISSYTASLLRKNRNRMLRHNLELMEKTAIMEEAEKKLQSYQQSLEMRVRERSAKLAKANEDLQADLTDRKRAEEALRESEARYRLLSEHMTDIVWLMDMNLKTTYQSPSVQKIGGFTLQENEETPLEKHLTPESLKMATDMFLAETAKIEADPNYDFVITLDLEFYHKNGTRFWAENKFSLIRDANGKPLSILGEGRDITERKQTEGALRRSEEKYRNILESIQEGYFEIDLTGNYTFTNEANCRYLGYTKEELIGMNYRRHIDEETAKKLY